MYGRCRGRRRFVLGFNDWFYILLVVFVFVIGGVIGGRGKCLS